MMKVTLAGAVAAALGFVTTSAQPLDLGLSGERGLQCDLCGVAEPYAAPKRLMRQSTEYVQTGTDDAAKVRQEDLHAWLSASRAPVSGPAFTVELTHQDLVDIGAQDSLLGDMLRPDPRRVQVGVDKALGAQVRFGSLAGDDLQSARKHAGGAAVQGLDGELVWSAVATSPGASALRIGIEGLDLPAGAELYAYTAQGEAFGPYTERGPNGDGTFWTNTAVGDELTLQLHYAGGRSQNELDRLTFRIASISHMGPKLPLADMIAPDGVATKAFCSYNESCVIPGSSSGSAPVGEAKDAVALMIYSSGGGAYICSGGLLADTDASSVIPYFLTANHCVSKGREASSLETVFDFDGSCNDRYGDGNYPNRTNGSSIKSTNRTSDYTLLELNQTPGGTRAYLGWTNAPVAFNAGESLYRISHPSGAPQAYSQHVVNTRGTCTSWPRGNWIYSTDVEGATEGGSSGSPVLNAAGEVVGQLSGGCGTNVGDVCDTANNSTVDGALAAYWSAVEPFLASGGGEPPPPPPSGDATVQSVTTGVQSRGPWNRGTATVRVVDDAGNPLPNATVVGTFSGDVSGSASGVTDASGVVQLRSDRTRSNVSSVSFCVDSVNGSTPGGSFNC